MRSLVPYSAGGLISQYSSRVRSDGGTLYQSSACRKAKIEALDIVTNPADELLYPYITRVMSDGGISYQLPNCSRTKINTYNV